MDVYKYYFDGAISCSAIANAVFTGISTALFAFINIDVYSWNCFMHIDAKTGVDIDFARLHSSKQKNDNIYISVLFY
jgi:hypothetical protein